MYFVEKMMVFLRWEESEHKYTNYYPLRGKPRPSGWGVERLTLKRKSFRLYFGSGQVLVGLLDFKSSDGQRCPWWVRFPCTSARPHRTAACRCSLAPPSVGTGVGRQDGQANPANKIKRRKKCLESECQS